MKKTVKIILKIVLIIWLIIASVYTVLHYFFTYSKSDWFEFSHNGYTVIGKEIGIPSWGGTSKALIEIYDTDENRIIVQFETHIDTNGEFLSESNYNVSINDDYIALSFYNYDGKVASAYRIYFEDFK